jgi:NAD(P)-dependent dehydrogenase (short-subunit alcohol dehydrogenase family)
VAEIQTLVRDILARLGQIDILVNVAGVNRRKPSTEITEEDWDSVLNLNLKGLFFASQAVGRYWIETRRFAPENNRGKGKIINIGSIAGEMGHSPCCSLRGEQTGRGRSDEHSGRRMGRRRHLRQLSRPWVH